MTDKPANTERWAGCDGNDPKPRMAGRIAIGGMPFQVSPTDGLNPAPQADGMAVKSTKNVPSNG